MKITKKPKRVYVNHEIVESTISKYHCPCCGNYFVGAGIGRNISRFYCRCGQELIIAKHIFKEEV